MKSQGWPPRRRIGGYELLAQLSAGGMGRVFLARRQGAHGFEKLLAVKVILDRHNGSDSLKAMFLDEAKLVAQLDHPGIAQVYDFGEDDGALFLAMEYVEGMTLRRLIRYRPPPGVVGLALEEVLRALHVAHELSDRTGRRLGVVHRDVSPENLMLTFSGRMKVLDFGVALRRGRLAPDTMVGEIRGKPSYMSPEQVNHGHIDQRADIFAAGLVFFELLTGEPVFSVKGAMAAAIAQAPLQPLAERSAALPEGLDSVVRRALELAPQDRYPSAEQMADAIHAVLAHMGQNESLEHYARRALGEERETASQWLRAQLGVTSDAVRPQGRPTSVATVREAALSPPVTAVAAPRPGFGWRRWLWVVFAGAVVVTVIALALALTFGFELPWLATRAPPKNTSGPPMGKETTATGAPLRSATPDTTADKVRSPEGSAAAKRSGDTAPAKTRPDKATVKAASGKAAAKKTSSHKGPPRKTRRPAVPLGFGHITVGATPFAIVWIDGAQVGTTPLVRHRLPVGEHTVRLVNPDDGRTRDRRVVTVTKGGHEKIVAR